MNWSNVKLILMREVRDQLRDRRTLFMIAVLPMLLYPLLGMSFFQVTQFVREHAIRVLVVGAPQEAGLPKLVDGERFAGNLFDEAKSIDLLQVKSVPARPRSSAPPAEIRDHLRSEMETGNYDVVVAFAPEFAARLEGYRSRLAAPLDASSPKVGTADSLVSTGDKAADIEAATKIPGIDLYPNLANDASKAAYRRVFDVLDKWREGIGRQNLVEGHVPPTAAKPFAIVTLDVAEEGQHKAALWSKILPFVLLLWALTGAFYPAIDLCAGEKERGTLETLLSSPAERIEIVWGKLLTIILFSMATAILNLTSLAVTGSVILSQLPLLGPPPGLAIIWMLVALVPVSALFGALCLALAAFARSTKEGQYYLMPLVLVTMPLTILPMAPGVQLNLGNSLIPVTGVVLVLRSVLEGNYLAALPYIPVVGAVTLGCCWMAIRWATNQFNTESVLFRESERWDVGLWIKHLLRDREPTPSFAEAMFCGVLILLIRFFLGFALSQDSGGRDLLSLAAVTQLVVVLTPALLMTVMLTRSPAQTLLLRRPPLLAPLAAALLALTLHPVHNLLHTIVMRVYPLSDELAKELLRLESGMTDNLWLTIGVIALLPAICEEIAFRGFILSGFRRMGRKWTAIALSSVLFGAMHVFFQQSLLACLLGLVIGFITVQSGSLLPAVVFHFVHNALGVLLKPAGEALADGDHWLHWLMRDASEGGPLYHWGVIAGGLGASAAIVYWFHRLPYDRTAEETLQEAITQQSAQWQPS